MQSLPIVKHRRTLFAAPVIICALAFSGCGLLGDDGNDLSSDLVPVDADQVKTITADTIEDDSSSNDQATIDDDGKTQTSEQTDDSSSTTESAPTYPTLPDNGFCEAEKRNNFEIRFAAGESSGTMTGQVPAGESDLYWIEVGVDQVMQLNLISGKDNALAAIMSPDGSVVPGQFIERTVAPTQAGLYAICVSSGEGSASYELVASVIDDNTPTKVSADWCGDSVNDRGEIKFVAGAFSGEVENGVLRGERDLYVLDAGAGQALDVLLTSLEDNAVFTLRGPDGEVIIDDVSDFRIPLPADGTYEFCIGGTRGNASYTMSVGIE